MEFPRIKSPALWAAWTSIPLGLLTVLGSCAGYETVPETGRTRPALQHSEQEMDELGAAAYEEATKDYRVIHGTPDAEMVDRVARRVAEATHNNYDWEFRLLDAPDMVNAFCLPGGKIAVYSGILPICEGEDGLAVVLGHEVAHATLQHANERMSEPLLKSIISLPIRVTTNLWGALSPGSRRAVMGAFGLGYLVAEFMPYSQEHEYEADEVGLLYMQRAGFDLDAAPEFWLRMVAAYPDQKDSDPLSTHPDAVHRAQRLKELVAEMKAGVVKSSS